MTICDGCDGILYISDDSENTVTIDATVTAMKERLIVMVGRLGYNSANGRYGLLVSDLWEDTGFHCGECLEVMVDDKWVATRMEMSAEQKWYLVGTPYYGNLEYVQARI